MPVRLTVREVRDALRRSDDPGDGEPSSALVGRIFHEAFAELVAGAKRAGEFGRAEELARRAYDGSIGPRLTAQQDALQPIAAEVARLWQATESLCAWLESLGAGSPGIEVEAERPLTVEIRQPGWTDSVVLSGIADAVVRDPRTGRWCVVELKLGRTHPRADLGQAALYHGILEGAGASAGPGAFALVSFHPERVERLIEADELAGIRPALLDLIGRLAGVLPEDSPDPDSLAMGGRLIDVLAEYGVPASLDGDPIVGPGLIRFGIEPGPGVKFAAIQRRSQELRIRLMLDSEPIVAIDGGRVIVDVPRRPRRVVPFGSVLGQLEALARPAGNPRLPVGVGLDGMLACIDLSEPNQAHCLVAGTAGSGKSEWLRAALAGLIATNTPDTLRLVLIDPKRTAFGRLRNSPFLMRPLVFPGEVDIEEVLDDLIAEMEDRYRLLEREGVDDLSAYVAKVGAPLPRIACACDEYADLLLGDPRRRKRLEDRFMRLGSKARAAGIHLILATQQPSRETLKGPLIANLGARVGLRMTSAIESRMLLGTDGAELLMGRGDLLYKAEGAPIRLQGLLLEPSDRDAPGESPGDGFRTS